MDVRRRACVLQTLYNIPLFREKIFGFRGESTVCVPDSTTTTDKADEDISLPDEIVVRPSLAICNS